MLYQGVGILSLYIVGSVCAWRDREGEEWVLKIMGRGRGSLGELMGAGS